MELVPYADTEADRALTEELESDPEVMRELGYFDQPHFIRDFRSQIGQTPAAYARACAAAAGREPALAA